MFEEYSMMRIVTSNFSHCSVRTVCQCKGPFTPIMIIMKITIKITMLKSTSVLFYSFCYWCEQTFSVLTQNYIIFYFKAYKVSILCYILISSDYNYK